MPLYIPLRSDKTQKRIDLFIKIKGLYIPLRSDKTISNLARISTPISVFISHYVQIKRKVIRSVSQK